MSNLFTNPKTSGERVQNNQCSVSVSFMVMVILTSFEGGQTELARKLDAIEKELDELKGAVSEVEKYVLEKVAEGEKLRRELPSMHGKCSQQQNYGETPSVARYCLRFFTSLSRELLNQPHVQHQPYTVFSSTWTTQKQLGSS